MPPELRLRQGNITPRQLDRKAVISMRPSRPKPVREPLDRPLTQRPLIPRAAPLGWHPERIDGCDGERGQSAAGVQERQAFQALAAAVALGHVGMVFGGQVSRLARHQAAWYPL